MPIERSVLVLDGGGAPRAALVHRLRRLGYRTLRAKSPEDAFRLVEEHRHETAVALIPPDLAVMELGEALAALAAKAPGGRLAYVVNGARPGGEALDELRSAGVTLALWDPFDDARLRFQVNRALADDDLGGLPRGEVRAPVDRPVQVLRAGRRSSARTYTLSGGGAYLETPRPAMRGAVLEIEIPIGPAPVRLPGSVVYTNVPGNLQRTNLPVGMGVRFAALPEAAAVAVRRLVAETSLALAL
jgi:CheY-like chemotaxis protein